MEIQKLLYKIKDLQIKVKRWSEENRKNFWGKKALIDASQDFAIRIQSKDGNVVDDLIRGNAYTFLLVDENNIVIGGIEEYPQFIVNYNGKTVVPINWFDEEW